ncbi:MAG: ABC transporter permease [Bryobacteraceae bacterium]|jgi:putative ABC transport system permease protein
MTSLPGAPGAGESLRAGLVRYHYELVTASKLGLDSIRAHKLRSFLTLLGVIIGVASVILVGSAIEGLGAYADESTAKVFGSKTFLVAQIASAVGRHEYFDKLKKNRRIRPEDLKYLEAVTGSQVLYSIYRQRSEDVKHESNVYEDASILGVSAALPELRDVTLAEGRFFTEQEERTKQHVCVIGQDIRAGLFPGSPAVGNTLKLSGIDFVVVGLGEKIGSSFGNSMDNFVYIPAPVYARLYGPSLSISIFGRARPETGMELEEALDLTRVALRARFHVRPGQPDRFDTLTPDAVRSFIDQILGMISTVIVPVTGISLVVGGIVVMNIMLVSVTERTHEIGIRKSLGARPSDIRLQFLLEAVFLAAAGGAVGVVCGAAATRLLSALFDITLRVTLPYIALSVLVSSAVGIVSGWYPARRAARLDPVEALRSE